jgi:hypothetical protein
MKGYHSGPERASKPPPDLRHLRTGLNRNFQIGEKVRKAKRRPDWQIRMRRDGPTATAIYNAGHMRRRAIWILAVVTVLAAAAATLVLLRKSALPEAARLLPAADGYVYLNLTPLRLAGVIKEMPAVSLDPEYENFVRETGFEFERDLDEVAFAVHRASGDPAQPHETRYSEVFVARLDAVKLTAYLRKLAKTVERYRDYDVFAIALPGRTVRVVLLGPSLVAASNTEGPYAIQGIIDRHKELSLPFGGPALLRKYYRDVPLASLAWAVLRAAPSGQANNSVLTLPGGYDLFFPPSTVIVASVRYVGSVQFKAAAYTGSEAEARRITDQLGAFVAVFRTVELSAQRPAPDPEIKAFFDSLAVTQHQDRSELTATIPQGFMKKLMTEPPVLGEEKPGQKPAPARKKGRKK